MVANITGKEYAVGKIFSDDFAFSIPPYQRPYSWTTEHAQLLLDDLLLFVQEDGDPITERQPYFLGSIVLIKNNDPQLVFIWSTTLDHAYHSVCCNAHGSFYRIKRASYPVPIRERQ